MLEGSDRLQLEQTIVEVSIGWDAHVIAFSTKATLRDGLQRSRTYWTNVEWAILSTPLLQTQTAQYLDSEDQGAVKLGPWP